MRGRELTGPVATVERIAGEVLGTAMGDVTKKLSHDVELDRDQLTIAIDVHVSPKDFPATRRRVYGALRERIAEEQLAGVHVSLRPRA
jgi:hypothetical protein